MGSARNILYGLAATLLLFSGAVAIQRSYLSHLDSLIAAAQPGRDSKPGTPGTSGFSEGDSGADAASDDRPVDPSTRVGPARSANAGALGRPSAAPQGAGPGSWSRNPGSAGDEGWVNRIPAAVASAFSFGSEAPVAPRPSVALSPGPANEAQVREVFFSEREETACQPGNRQFRLEAVQGLHVCVVWAGLAGAYAQQVTFVSPDGQVYQTLTQGFATAGTPATGTVEVDGRPYDVKPAGWGANGATLVTAAALPVAGTYITKYNIAGLWTVKVSLNGELLGQESFQLLPRP